MKGQALREAVEFEPLTSAEASGHADCALRSWSAEYAKERWRQKRSRFYKLAQPVE